MSNGIGKNPLNDISKVYLEQVGKKKKKKDDSYLETDMKKRQENNEKAREDMKKMGTSMKNPHFEQKQFGWDSVNSMTKAYRAMQEGIRDEDPEKGTEERKKRLEKKRGMKMDDHPQYTKKENVHVDMAADMLDEQGAPYKDLKGFKPSAFKDMKQYPATLGGKKGMLSGDEGARGRSFRVDPKDHDAAVKTIKSNRLQNRDTSGRGAGLAAFTKEALDPVGKEDGDVNNDGKKDDTDSYLMKRRKAIGSAMKKRLKEERASLSEVMTDKEDEKKVVEKRINNKVTINPKLSEAVEELGGEVLEMVEIDEENVGSSTPVKQKEYSDWRSDLQEGPMIITNADVKGNTKAFQNYKAGMKSKITGKPMYQLAPHVKLANSHELEGDDLQEIDVKGMVKGALDKGAEVMKKNPVGRAVSNVLKPVGSGSGTARPSVRVQDRIRKNQAGMEAVEVDGETIDERTRYAKETGKDPQTGKESKKGGTRDGKSAFDQVSRQMRKTGGVMSSRGKGIQPQGKKKEKGKKGYKGVTPVDKIRNRLSQKRKEQPNPYRTRAGESD